MQGECVTTLETMGHFAVIIGYCWGNVNKETIADFLETTSNLLFLNTFSKINKGTA